MTTQLLSSKAGKAEAPAKSSPVREKSMPTRCMVSGNGAAILIALEDRPYGGRVYSCRDSEGHMWPLGSYDGLGLA